MLEEIDRRRGAALAFGDGRLNEKFISFFLKEKSANFHAPGVSVPGAEDVRMSVQGALFRRFIKFTFRRYFCALF